MTSAETMAAHDLALLSGKLPIWTIYKDQGPRADLFVARMFLNNEPTNYVIGASSLDDLRDLLPPGLMLFNRAPTDSPEIVEVWL